MNGSLMSPYRKIWYLMYPILAYSGIFYVIESIGSVLAFAFAIAAVEQGGGTLDYYVVMEQMSSILDGYSYELNALAAAAAIPAELLFLRMDVRNRTLRGTEPARSQVPAPYYAVTLILGAASCLALNNMMSLSGLFGTYSENLNEVTEQLYRGQLLIEILGVGLVIPILEEILFRGVLQNRVREMTNANVAIVGSAILFGCYHGNLLQMIYTSILGLIFGFVYERYRTLAAPCLVHIGANLVSVIGSETAVLDFMYQNDTMVIVQTAVWCAVIFLCIYLVHDHINPPELHRGGGDKQN